MKTPETRFCAYHPERGYWHEHMAYYDESVAWGSLMRQQFKFYDKDTGWDALIDSQYWELVDKLKQAGWEIHKVEIVKSTSPEVKN